MAHRKITLLGGFQVKDDGRFLVGFQSDKARALLAYLSVEADRSHWRTQLAGLFWPEWPDQTALTYLRHALANLRKVLGENDAQEPPFLVTRDTLQFNIHSDYQVDVAAVVHCLQTLTAPSPNIAQLQQAVEAYQHPFLDGFSLAGCAAFEEWMVLTREQLQRQIVEALRHLADHFEAQGDYQQARTYAHRRVDLEPWLEDAHRQLMHLYALGGQRGAALAQYESCRRLLAAELGVEPSAETTALYEAIRTGQFDHAQWAPARWQDDKMTRSSPHPVTSFPKHNLPAPTTPLLGRTKELASVQALLQRTEVRLVTLTGPGGVGKTRLGLAVAQQLLDEFTDGVFVTFLAPIRDINLVASAIAQTLGVSESASQPPLETLKVALQHKQMLLVLDNFEHIIAAAASVTTLLAACAHLKIVVTSREVLQVQGEHEFSVSMLSIPKVLQDMSLAVLSQYAAGQLFIARAQAVNPDFTVDSSNASTIAAICVRLDGLPLAIELAAVRIKLFSPQVLLRKLTGTTGAVTLAMLNSAARDVPERHQTLRRTIAWSYDLLSSDEQKLFRQLSVFVGGFCLEAASAVCEDPSIAEERIARGIQICWPSAEFPDIQTVSHRAQTPIHVAQHIFDGVASLVNKSLVQCDPQPDGEPRFVMLETIREYGLELLQAQGELVTVQRAHAGYYLLLAVESEPHLHGMDESTWVQRLALEHSNLRAALDWAVAQREIALAMHLVNSLLYFWHRTNHRREAVERLTNILALTDNLPPSFTYGRFLFNMALAIEGRDGITGAAPFYQRSLIASRAVGDKYNLANSLNKLGGIAYKRGDYTTWEAYLRESEPLKLEVGGYYLYALVMGFTGRELTQLGRFEEGRALCEQALTLHRQLGDKWGLIIVLVNYSQAALLWGDVNKAEELAQESLELAGAMAADHLLASAKHRLGLVALARTDCIRAEKLLGDALQTHCKHQNYHAQVGSLEAFAALAVAQQQPLRALHLAAALARQYNVTDIVLPPVLQCNYDQMVASAQQQLDQSTSAAAWAAGEAMTLDEAVAYALAAVA